MSNDMRKFCFGLGTFLLEIVILFLGLLGAVYFLLGPGGCGLEDTCSLKGNAGSLTYTVLSAAIILLTLIIAIWLPFAARRIYRNKPKSK